MTSTISKYGSSCLKCRKRKVRCDGSKPACKNCVRSDTRCVYNAYDSTVRLQNALLRNEKRLENLATELGHAVLLCPEDCRERLRTILNELKSPPTLAYGDSDITNLPNVPAKSVPEQISPQTDLRPWNLTINDNAHGTNDEEAYLVTSRFHIDEDGANDRSGKHSRDFEPEQVRYHRRWLQSNARFQQSYESMAYTTLLSFEGLDADTARILLQLYWTWQAPLHNCVYRRTFFRDMAIGGPYFSKFLLNVIFAHACRHTQASDPRFVEWSQGEVFLERAKLLLLDELKKDQPAIPTIQGLLILGGRQCAMGKSSEGWLYTGMAIRMILDLGFHLVDVRVLGNAEPDDLEARKRLFLSAFVWDKSISLTLGRPPSLTHMPFPEHCLYDLSDDDDLWRPHLLGELESVYLPTKGYFSTTFSHFCKLAAYINLAYQTVFGPQIYKAHPQTFKALEDKLREFYADLPSGLRMSEISQHESCPPPHICCLNILYHTVLILVYRPFFRKRHGWRNYDSGFISHAIEICKREAAAVNAFFQAYGRSFDFQNQTYLLSYCVYTAATIEVELVGDGDAEISQGAIERLATTLRMLDTEARQTPGIRRSVEIIKERLDRQNEESSDIVNAAGAGERSGFRYGRRQSLYSRQHSATDVVEQDTLNTSYENFHASQTTLIQTARASTIETQPWFASDEFMPYLDGFDGSNVGGGFMPNILSWNLE